MQLCKRLLCSQNRQPGRVSADLRAARDARRHKPREEGAKLEICDHPQHLPALEELRPMLLDHPICAHQLGSEARSQILQICFPITRGDLEALP